MSRLLIKWTLSLIFLFNFTKPIVQDGRCIGQPDHCYCDELCSLYGDCCHQFQRTNKSIAQCYRNHFLINKCLPNVSNNLLVEKCENQVEMNSSQLVYHVPVYGQFGNNYMAFKNKFCAICNEKFSVKFATVKIVLGRTVLNKTLSEIKFEIPLLYKRNCYENVIDNCPPTENGILRRLCREEPTFYIGMSSRVETTYRNVYCYLCNMQTPSPKYLDSRQHGYSEALDYNQWCLEDCEELLKSFRYNKTLSSNDSSIPSTHDKDPLAFMEKVITLTLSSASLMGLIFMLFVYSCIENHENRAGKITIYLALSALFLTITNIGMSSMENPSAYVCFVISIMYHYCFLCSYSWMSLFAFDVYQSITSSSVIQKKSFTILNSKRLKIYILLGYITPLSFSMAAMITQLVNENHVLSAGFGERNCFINRLIGGLFWFFIPLLFFLLFNIIICGLLYRFIYSMHQETALVRNIKRARQKNFLLCIKLSIIFGIVWLPVFIGVFLQSYILKFVGDILASLQGVLLSFCFICGVNVRRKTFQYLQSITENLSGLSS